MVSQLIVLCILILLNAYFAATEIAFISLNDAKISKQAKDGNKKAKQIQKMLENPSKFLATIQIGITLAGFLSSAFASDAFADKLAPMLYTWFPAIALSVWKTVSIITITIILSFFTLVFGELIPKRLAMKHYEKISFSTIGVIKNIALLTHPFVRLLTFSTNVISKLFGVSEKDEETVTEEEILMMIDQGQEKGTIEKEEKELITNIFEFNDKLVSEVMTPRTEMFALDIDSNFQDVIEELADYKYSRIPVYAETIDDIQGIVFIKDILVKLSKNEPFKFNELVKTTYFVPESKPIDEVFRELQKKKIQMAIVLDEYGGTAGLITMEDIIEEIVGNIFDEHDDYEKEFEVLDANTFMINGSLSIHELEKILNIDIPEGEYDTLSGYLIEELGRFPMENEHPVIETDTVTYRIEKYEDRRITWVKACKNNIHADSQNNEIED